MNHSKLKSLVEQHPIYLPLPEVASLLCLKPEALRASIDQGRCPFGFSWKLGDRSGYKIPTATFIAWFLKGIAPDALTV